MYYEIFKTEELPYLTFLKINVNEETYLNNQHIIFKLDKEPILIYGISEYDLIDGKLVKRNVKEFENRDIREQYYEKILNTNINMIGSETNQEINKGFEFDGNVFSLSIYAQINWNRFLLLSQSDLFQDTEISTLDSKRYILKKESLYDFIMCYNKVVNESLIKHREKLDKVIENKYNVSINL